MLPTQRSRHSSLAVRGLFSFIAILGLLPLMFSQSQKSADDCQDIKKHVKKDQDRFKGTTTLRLDEMVLSEKPPNEKLTLQVEVTSTDTGNKPKEVKLIFNSQAPRMRLFQGEEAIFLADDKRVRSISAVDGVADQFGMSTRFEKKNVVLAYDDFVTLANAENVEMKLAAVETKFDKKALKALHALVSCTF